MMDAGDKRINLVGYQKKAWQVEFSDHEEERVVHS